MHRLFYRIALKVAIFLYKHSDFLKLIFNLIHTLYFGHSLFPSLTPPWKAFSPATQRYIHCLSLKWIENNTHLKQTNKQTKHMKTTELKQPLWDSFCSDQPFLHTQSTLGTGCYSIVTFLKTTEFPACRRYQLYITFWSGVEFRDHFPRLSWEFVWIKVMQILGLLSSSIWVQMCNSSTVSGKRRLVDVILHLWLLSSFHLHLCTLLYKHLCVYSIHLCILSSLESLGKMHSFHLCLRAPNLLFLYMSVSGSLYWLQFIARRTFSYMSSVMHQCMDIAFLGIV